MMALHPVGPLPASTYWRRRLGLLLGVLVLLLIARSCASGGDEAPSAGQSTPTPTATVTPGATPTATATPTGAAAPLCADGDLTLTTTTDASTYPLGATPKITMQVKNTSAAACRRDLGSGAVELLVFSGADRIWSSDDCTTAKATAVVTLPAGGAQSVVKTWPGRRSLPGCSGSKAAAEPGTYKAVGRVGTLRRDGAVFRLHA